MQSYVIDDDKDVVINVTTRTIESDVLKNTKLIKGDHKSERITFNISRYIENKDLLDCDKIEIHYINMGSASNISKGVYTVTDASEVDSNTIRFSWLISMNATLYPGNLYFVIKFVNIDENNVIVYSWSTATNKDLIVGDSLDCDVVVDEEYLDILAQWESDITNNVINDVKKSITAKDVSYVGGMDNIPLYVENVDDALWELNRAIRETRMIKQDLLVSGETIKTINGESILGAGNIDILAQWEESIRDDIGKTITNLEKRISRIDSDVSDLMGLEEQCVVECDIIERNGELHIGNLSKTFDEIYEVWSGYDYDNSRGRDIVVKAQYRTEYNDMVYIDFKLNALREDICFEFVAHNLYDDDTTSLLIITLNTHNHQAIYRTTFATKEQLGSIDEALDGIIEIQNTLIGGESA